MIRFICASAPSTTTPVRVTSASARAATASISVTSSSARSTSASILGTAASSASIDSAPRPTASMTSRGPGTGRRMPPVYPFPGNFCPPGEWPHAPHPEPLPRPHRRAGQHQRHPRRGRALAGHPARAVLRRDGGDRRGPPGAARPASRGPRLHRRDVLLRRDPPRARRGHRRRPGLVVPLGLAHRRLHRGPAYGARRRAAVRPRPRRRQPGLVHGHRPGRPAS